MSDPAPIGMIQDTAKGIKPEGGAEGALAALIEELARHVAALQARVAELESEWRHGNK